MEANKPAQDALVLKRFETSQDEIREQIKSAARDASFIGELDSKTHRALVRNPFCGDEIEVTVQLSNDDFVSDLKAQVRGCLVARAAWSLIAPKVKGQKRAEVIKQLKVFDQELSTEAQETVFTSLDAPLSSLLAYRLPSPRHSCATLGSQALLQALQPKNCNQ